MKVEVHLLVDVLDAKSFSEAMGVVNRASDILAFPPKNARKLDKSAVVLCSFIRPAVVDDPDEEVVAKIAQDLFQDDYDMGDDLVLVRHTLVKHGLLSKVEEIDEEDFIARYGSK